MQTQKSPEQIAKIKRTAGRRTAQDFAFGDRYGCMLRRILPDCECSGAAATCDIQIMGWQRGMHEGNSLRDYRDKPFRGKGRWVSTRMKTNGKLGQLQRFSMNGPKSRWVHADSFEGADEVLGCFGLTTQDLIDHYGPIEPDTRLILSLRQIVADLCKNLNGHCLATFDMAGSLTNGQ